MTYHSQDADIGVFFMLPDIQGLLSAFSLYKVTVEMGNTGERRKKKVTMKS